MAKLDRFYKETTPKCKPSYATLKTWNSRHKWKAACRRHDKDVRETKKLLVKEIERETDVNILGNVHSTIGGLLRKCQEFLENSRVLDWDDFNLAKNSIIDLIKIHQLIDGKPTDRYEKNVSNKTKADQEADDLMSTWKEKHAQQVKDKKDYAEDNVIRGKIGKAGEPDSRIKH